MAILFEVMLIKILFPDYILIFNGMIKSSSK